MREEGFVHAHRLRLPRRRTRRRATENLYPQNRDAGAACFACGRKLIRARAHDRLQHCKSDSAVSHQFGHRPLWLQPCVRVALGYLACRNPQLHRKKNQAKQYARLHAPRTIHRAQFAGFRCCAPRNRRPRLPREVSRPPRSGQHAQDHPPRRWKIWRFHIRTETLSQRLSRPAKFDYQPSSLRERRQHFPN